MKGWIGKIWSHCDPSGERIIVRLRVGLDGLCVLAFVESKGVPCFSFLFSLCMAVRCFALSAAVRVCVCFFLLFYFFCVFFSGIFFGVFFVLEPPLHHARIFFLQMYVLFLFLFLSFFCFGLFVGYYEEV